MKKLWVIPILALLLAGCGGEKTLETVGDVEETPVIATMQRVLLQLPEELSAPVLQSEKTGTLYICDDYSVTVQTVAAGDLGKTIRNATGMDRADLQIMQTEQPVERMAYRLAGAAFWTMGIITMSLPLWQMRRQPAGCSLHGKKSSVRSVWPRSGRKSVLAHSLTAKIK